MAAPKKIIELVERFVRNRDAYLSGGYNEAQVRQEFINPMFIELGWDIFNEAGFAEAYKDVVHEDSLRIGGAHKAPDYSFRVGGRRKFFLEAKKPSINIKDDIHPAYQTRRYAWSAKLPLSILTDFDEFAVYDCRVKPLKTDKASTARIIYFKHTELEDRWEEIRSIFSKDAVQKGDYDRYVESTKKKRGTAEVDDTFLKEIERWREMLAKNIAIRNGALDEREINFVLGRTIDRIIFLRMCEDRGIEDYGRLQALQNGTEVYSRLKQLYYLADERFNSGLFHFKEEKEIKEPPDDLSMSVSIDDKPLKDIFKNLYYPDSPFEFSVLPPEILGQVYEQFLGKVIRLTKGHRAVVEYKPEVKKAGGVYYTPEYIVEYIVKNTVGKALEGKSPVTASKLSIVDPACGSGSFLLNAYQFLLDWFLEKYSKNPTKHKKVIYKVNKNEWRLTTAERKRILLTNIYGVDIDAQAVEVTKLSLLLKVLEGETGETLQQSLKLYHERALPDLSQNIKCGNSLIGSDFYDNQQLDFLDDKERYRINVFDWEDEFPEIFSRKNPGFDVVIGNPPYVRQEGIKNEKKYYQSRYSVFKSTADLYTNFVEKGITILNSNGIYGMILSNKWLKASYGEPLRKFILEKSTILELIDFAGLPVFQNATVRTIILLSSKRSLKEKSFKYLAPLDPDIFKSIISGEKLYEYTDKLSKPIYFNTLSGEGWSLSNIEKKLLTKNLKLTTLPLKNYLSEGPFRGIITGLNEAFIIDRQRRDELIAINQKNEELIKPVLGGRNVRRYSIEYQEQYIILTQVGISIEQYDGILDHLEQYKSKLKKRWDQGNEWWELRPCKYYQRFNEPKIIYPDISTNCRFTLDLQGYFSTNTTYFIPGNDLYLLGLLNSKVGLLYFTETCAGLESKGSTYLRFFGQYLENFPVPTINYENPEDKNHRDTVVKLVQQMLQLNKDIQKAKTSHKKEVIQRQINATDKQIDKLVYKLYDLTEKEIAIVEEGVN